MTHASRRFIELIGRERLDHGSRMSEPCHRRTPVTPACFDGKEKFIIFALYGINFESRYRYGTAADDAYHTGASVEHSDLCWVAHNMRKVS